jgi:hypothetical protein
VSGAEFVGQLIATDTMTSFQRARRIVEAGVNDSTVPRTRAHANFRKRFQKEDIAPAIRESARNRAAYDAPTNDHYVGLFHGLQFIRTTADSRIGVSSNHPQAQTQKINLSAFRGAAALSTVRENAGCELQVRVPKWNIGPMFHGSRSEKVLIQGHGWQYYSG